MEDERSLSDALVELLRQNQYAVDAVYDGEAACSYALSGLYDLILLDIMLPRLDGLAVLKALRAQRVSTPVLLLTARSEVADKIAGLDAGADDYLTKPFATGELLARVRAMTRRAGVYVGDTVAVGGTSLDKRSHELRCGGSSVSLGQKEYQIMELLAMNPQQVIPRGRFMEKIWGFDSEAEYNVIEVYVSFLRRKLEAIESDLRIRAVRGVGYSLAEEEAHS